MDKPDFRAVWDGSDADPRGSVRMKYDGHHQAAASVPTVKRLGALLQKKLVGKPCFRLAREPVIKVVIYGSGNGVLDCTIACCERD